MTVTITEPAAISVTATAENTYAVSMATGSSIPVTVSIPNKGDKGDQGDPGAILPTGVDKEVQYNDGGVLGADTNFKWDKNTKTLRIGIEDDTPLPTNPIAMIGSVNTYLQANIKNTNEGVNASSDYVATADNGDDSSHYIDMGINSSVYANPEYTGSTANDGYLLVEGGDLDLMSTDEVHVHAGGYLSENIVATFKPGEITLPSGTIVTNRPEVFYGTGSPPSATGLADGSLFFKYEV